MAQITKKHIAAELLDLSPDNVKTKTVGGVKMLEVREHYFYRHRRSQQVLARKIMLRALKRGLKVTIVDMDDHWREWRKGDSYFYVLFHLENNNDSPEYFRPAQTGMQEFFVQHQYPMRGQEG